jgi:tRNA (guanine37-N1)-methyltransferase
MRFDVVTCLPDLLKGPLDHSILQRAAADGLIEIQIHDLRNFGLGQHRQIDDYQYGGGAGMVMMVEPLDRCLSELKKQHAYDEVIYLSPDGESLNQKMANSLSLKQNLLLICGHYKGIDERIRIHHVTREISIGDYVLTGGELAAMVLIDAVSRLLPGTMNDGTSALTDSFQDDLLAPPVYTRPSEYKGWKVPEILLSGHDAKIEEWRRKKAYERTLERRPDLLQEGEGKQP